MSNISGAGSARVSCVLVTDPDVGLLPEAIGLVLVLLDLPGDLGHLPPLAEVDQLFPRPPQEVRVALLRLQDVSQVDPCQPIIYIHEIYYTSP